MGDGQRLNWLDAARGIGIILVVLGHTFTSVNDAPFRDTIYIFHMPLFFILSGYMSKPGPLQSYTIKRAIGLLIPYFSYLVIIGLPVAIFGNHRSGRSFAPEFLTYFYGGAHLVTWMTVFWFVTCLFFASVGYRAMLNLRQSALDIGMIGLIFLMYILSYALTSVITFPTPLALSIVPMAIVLIWVGHAFRYFDKYNIAFAVLSSVIIIFLSFYYHKFPFFSVDLKNANYGPPLIGLVTAASFSLLVIDISKRLDSIKYVGSFLQWLGSASISIMFLSQPIILQMQHLQINDYVVAPVAIILPLCIHRSVFQFQPFSLLFTGKLDGLSAISSKLRLEAR